MVFGLTDEYPEANLRHYTFMLEGLKDVQEALEKRGIKMVVREGSPDEVALDAGKDASLIVTDRGYMRPQKKWREKVAREADCLVTQVESDVVVPVELASGKQEHAARTPAEVQNPRRLPGRALDYASRALLTAALLRSSCRRMGRSERPYSTS